ncbi:hypothetical protein E6C60_3896 [Paenibacillus algicola]|uniref:Uncharacterized protein n=1 Tax=Paenibacillus algicola TaxID=2565926 RepID=A0A4P8XRW5_9BACL|nr:hypothetical protein E6C60_3896 [Paenibacillus algicola]
MNTNLGIFHSALPPESLSFHAKCVHIFELIYMYERVTDDRTGSERSVLPSIP